MSDEVERWKNLDAASYDDVAEQFDRFSNRLSAAAATRLLSLAGVQAGDRILDVGTGAGLLPFQLVHGDVAIDSVVGVDISTGMVTAARNKASSAGLSDALLRFEQMDAEHLQFEDGSFDVALSAFALTHVPHPDVALHEIFRVLRPGGRIAVAVGSRPPSISLAWLLHAGHEVQRRLQQVRGRRLTADLLDRIILDDYGPAPHDHPRGSELSVREDRAGLLTRLVRDAGFAAVRRSWRNYQNEVATPEEFWDIHRTIRSDARKRLLHAPEKMVEAVQTKFMASCRQTMARDGAMVFPISAVFVLGQKPTIRS